MGEKWGGLKKGVGCGCQGKAESIGGLESRARLPMSCRVDRMECWRNGRGEGKGPAIEFTEIRT